MFEGPLDLLLHLVKKHELSILDIPIAFVTEKYLEYLDAMAGLDIDVAGEYLADGGDAVPHQVARAAAVARAARGGRPRRRRGRGGRGRPARRPDPRLLEYQKYKEAADQLGQRPVVGRNVWGRGTPTEDAVGEGVDPDAIAPLAPFPVHKLIEAFDRVMRAGEGQGRAQRPDRPAVASARRSPS